MHPRDANNAGVRDGDDVWLEGRKAAGREGQGDGCPSRVPPEWRSCHSTLPDIFRARDLRDKYPPGTDPCAGRSL